MSTQKNKQTVIVGAGLVGSLLSIALAQKGYAVAVYERRSDMRRYKVDAGRSINLAISTRGISALKKLGIADSILKSAIPMYGRQMHDREGALTFQKYGAFENEYINSISRGTLNQALMTLAENTGKVNFHYQERLTFADLHNRTLHFTNETTQKTSEVNAQYVFGTDGSASVLREAICTKDQIKASILDYGYKELSIPPGINESHLIEKNALHIWPRGSFMLIALPNVDGSFTCTLFLPFNGTKAPYTFENLNTPAAINELFEKEFKDVKDLIENKEKSFSANPTGHMTTVKCSPWHYQDFALLLGDAAHAIVPFFGQGMNCGFEDVSILFDQLTEGNSLEEIFSDFTNNRPKDSDAIADLAVENFIEMRDLVADKKFLLKKAIEKVLERNFHPQYTSRYSLVSFSDTSYSYAKEIGEIQKDILEELSQTTSDPEKLDLNNAKKLIDQKLKGKSKWT